MKILRCLILSFMLINVGILFSDPPEWTVMTGNEHNMTVMADVTFNGMNFDDSDADNMVGAFGPDGDDDCRAIGVYQTLGFWWFTVRSNASSSEYESITFKLYNAELDEVYDCEQEYPVTFIVNGMIGEIDDRLQLFVMTFPVGNEDNYEVDEDSLLSIDALSGVLNNDEFPVDSLLTAELEVLPQNGELSFNSDGSFDYAPNADYNGNDVFYYRALAYGYYSELTAVNITIHSVNDAPEIDLPESITILEDEIIELDFEQYITDVDGDDLLLISEGGESIHVEINGMSVTISVESNWNGMEEIVFSVDDGIIFSQDELEVYVTAVNDPPVIALPESVNFFEDTATELDFSQYIYDPDEDENLWLSVAGNQHVIVEISELLVNFSAEPNWNGSEEILFTVTDSESSFDSQYLTVNVFAVNDPPEIELPDGGFTFDEDGFLIEDFSLYITDIDMIEGALTVTGNENIFIEITEFEVEFSALENWNGIEVLTFTIDDEQGRAVDSDSIEVTVNPVNDPPVIELPQSYVFEEDGIGIEDFSIYIYDIEDDELELEVFGNEQITVEIDGFEVTFSAEEDWNGVEGLVFEVTELGYGSSDADTVLVEFLPVNDPPEIEIEDEYIVHLGEVLVVDFSEYIYDIDSEILDLQVSGNLNVIIEIDGFEVSFSSEGWVGSELVYFIVSDLEDRLTSLDSTLVTVLPANSPPEMVLPESFITDEDVILVEDFSVYITDIDEDELFLTAAGMLNIDVLINELEVSFSAPENWFGEEVIYFEVTDGEFYDSDSVLVIVNSVNDAPQFTGLYSELVIDSLYIEDFESYIIDPDNEELFLSVSGNDNILIGIDGYSVSIDASGWTGIETVIFTIDDLEGRAIDTAEVEIISVVDAEYPIILLPEELTMEEDGSLELDFEDYILNDTGMVEYELTASGNVNIQVYFNDNSVTIEPDADWNGAELIEFSINADDYSFSDEINVIVEAVDDLPVIDLEPAGSFSFDEDDTLNVDLSMYISDIDNDIYDYILTAEGNTEINIEIDVFDVTFTATENWFGEEIIEFTIDDQQGITASDTISVIVEPVNDDPFIELPDNFTFDEDSSLIEDFSAYISDADGDELSLSVTGNNSITVEINEHIVTFSAPLNWNGAEILEFTVNDNQARPFFSDEVGVIVDPVDDAPQITGLPDEWLIEEDQQDLITFGDYILNVDDDAILLSFSGNENVMIVINGLDATISATENWTGTELVYFTITDDTPEQLSYTDSINIVFQPQNDPPYVYEPIADTVYEEDFMQQEIDLNGHFADPDDDILSYSVEFTDTTLCSYEISEMNILQIDSVANVFGETEVIVTASDNINRETAQDTFLLSILPVNDAPVIELPSSLMAVEESQETIDLSDYIYDVDDDELNINIQQMEGSQIDSISIDGLSITVIDDLWNVFEEITVTVTDSSLAEASDITELRLFSNNITPENVIITLPALDGYFPGDTVILPVEVNYILPSWEINGFSFELFYDEDILQFQGYNWENTIAGAPNDRDSFYWDEFLSGSGAIINILFQYESEDNEQAVVELDDFEFLSPSGNFIPLVIDGIVNNDYPQLINPLEYQAFYEDFEIVSVDLNFVFADNSNSPLYFSAYYSSEDFLIDIDENMMSITSIADRYTIEPCDVVISCSDAYEYSVSDTFSVMVLPVNDPPDIASFIPIDSEINIAEPQEISFEVIATDIDSDLEYSWLVNDVIVGNQSPQYTRAFNLSNVYDIKCRISDGEFETGRTWTISLDTGDITEIHASRNYPNPFRSETWIDFELPETKRVFIDVFNAKGQKIDVVVHDVIPKGKYKIAWKAQKHNSGIYFFRFTAGKYSKTWKTVLLRD